MAWDVLQGQEYEERKPGIRAVLMRMSTSLHCLANRAISASINSLDISLAYPPTPSPDSLISTSKGSAPNDLNCSRAAGLKRKWTNRSIYYISLNHYNTNNIWPGVKSSDNGSHRFGSTCCCETSYSTTDDQDLEQKQLNSGAEQCRYGRQLTNT